MTTEQFLQFANPLPEPMLLVSTEGIVCAANHAVRRRLQGLPRELVGQRLYDWVVESADDVARYLQACSRTRDLLPGSLVLRGRDGETIPCRCDGAVLLSRSEEVPALIQLRLIPKADAPSQFILLNQRIHALTTEIAARKRAEDNLQKRQAEVEALNERLERAIAETHHRVKNNLQAVISLLEMQKDEAAEGLLPVESLSESILQIKTIALVHDVLSHEGPISEVDARVVLGNLVELLTTSLRSGGKPAPLSLQADCVWLLTQTATALALVVNELISNACKHGCLAEKDQENNRICVRFSAQENELLLEVEDNGTGFPRDFDVATHANLGLSLVQSLVANDLQGRLFFGTVAAPGTSDRPPGGRVLVRFPAPSRNP